MYDTEASASDGVKAHCIGRRLGLQSRIIVSETRIRQNSLSVQRNYMLENDEDSIIILVSSPN